ncbi:Fanconi anemia group d2 protein, partial [Thalictrum thalictroides]
KEIIGSLSEIIGGDEKNNDNVVESLQQLLQEDSEVIVPVFDSFSNLHLSEKLQEQVVTIGLSFIRTIDAQHMPFLLRFLLLSATSTNARRIISQIRHHLKFVGGMNFHSSWSKGKGKSVADNFEGLVLEALRSSLRFKNILCQEIINELKSFNRAEDHKVIDVWLLMLIYMNGGTLQKTVEKVVKKKIIDDCLGEAIFDQCIHGHRELVQEYFPSFLSVCEYLLVCKEKKAREFGIHLYVSLFDEFSDTYSRHEILGALVTHIGSGVVFEVGSALNAMVLLASKYLQELIPLSSYIIGILDYIEGFNDENLHKVYEVFSLLALSARSNADSIGSSIANELLIVVRKQVCNQDLKYKKMGLIGTLKIVSCLGNMNNATNLSSSQKTNCEESLELLGMSLDSCKSFPLPMIMFYDELIALLECTKLQPAIMDWIGKHVGDFESIFLSDLEGGQLLSAKSFCGLEGELWMNLDGDLSPICLNMLPLVSSLQSSSSLQILPAYFLLLSVVERLTNQGSLGGIDALLGCPLYLPSPKYFVKTVWSSLTGKQKQAMCLSLYYAFNWIRELLNAFCTQVTGSVDCTSQTTRDEIIAKLLKRLRNLVFLESLLNTSLKLHPLPLPELHLFMEHSGSSFGKPNLLQHMEKKNEKRTISQSTSLNKNLKRKSSTISDNGKLKQPTILDVLRRSGALSQEVHERLSDQSSKGRTSQHEEKIPDSNDPEYIEISVAAKILDGQIFKCRALSVDCLSLLTFSKAHDTCCSDSAAELPLHLYLLRDLCHKLDCLTPQTKQNPGGSIRAPFGNSRVMASEFVNKIKNLFPSLKKHFECAVCILKEGEETCQEHWKIQSASAKNPDIPSLVVSKSSVAGSVIREALSCLRKMLNLPDIKMNMPVLSYLLKAFQPMSLPDSVFTGIQPIPSPGNMDYLYCGAFSFMEGVLDTACSSSVLLASEVLLTLESIVDSANYFLEGMSKSTHIGFVQNVIPTLRSRVCTSAHKMIMHNWDCDNLDNGWKSKGETIQKTLQIYFQHSDSTADLLEEFACSILPQTPAWKAKSTEEAVHGIPTLCATTFIIWYRALFEENHAILIKLVKEVIVQEKSRVNIQVESVKALLIKLHQSVKVVVSLVNMCKTHDKVAVHAMAVKYGGKFVDSFLKVFDFLQAHFQAHGEIIIQLVKELQKATRTIQTLCSEAKGSKRTMITSKIPATKRSMERFLFQVKALLHNTTNGCTFWMGNLKHKDLYGQVVSSQVYADVNTDVDDVQNDIDEEEPRDHMDEDVEEQPFSIYGQQGGEAEPCI